MTMQRRKSLALLGALAAAPALLPMRAEAAKTVLKFANSNAPDHPLNVRLKEAAGLIREQTHGDVEIRIFPSSQLGGDVDVLSQLRSGAVDFFTLSGLILSNYIPVTAIHGVGFAFKDYDVVWNALDGDLGNHLRQQIAKAGLHAFDKNWDDGFTQFFSSTKPINTPDDLQGFKLRVPASPLFVSLFKTLGASPVAINWAETYTALQTKVVDGLGQSFINMVASKVYEVQKYCSVVNFSWNGFFLLSNGAKWKALPDAHRNIISKNFNEAAIKQRADVAQLNGKLKDELTKHGIVFSTPETGPFRTVLQKGGYYAEWKKNFGDEAWGLLEKYSGKLS
jgi:tripartite ATP-independent transporter DctP family solute receptor